MTISFLKWLKLKNSINVWNTKKKRVNFIWNRGTEEEELQNSYLRYNVTLEKRDRIDGVFLRLDASRSGRAASWAAGQPCETISISPLFLRIDHSHLSSLLNTMKKGCGCLKPYMVTIETEWPWSISMNTRCIPAQLCFCNLPVLLHYDAGSHRVHTTQIGLTTSDNMEVWTLWTIFFNSVKWSTTYDICTLTKLHNELLVQSILCATFGKPVKTLPWSCLWEKMFGF